VYGRISVRTPHRGKGSTSPVTGIGWVRIDRGGRGRLALKAALYGEGDRTVGSTRFWKIDRQNRKQEIGHTWISASWQRTFVNTEIKFLILRFAFEQFGSACAVYDRCDQRDVSLGYTAAWGKARRDHPS